MIQNGILIVVSTSTGDILKQFLLVDNSSIKYGNAVNGPLALLTSSNMLVYFMVLADQKTFIW